jgi:hypothetical protein
MRLGLVLTAVLFAALFLYALLAARDGLLATFTILAAGYVLAPVAFPVRYRLDPEGLTRTSGLTRRYVWDRFARYEVGPGGHTIVLRFAGRRGALGNGVTLFLPDADTSREAIARLERWLGPRAATRAPVEGQR